MARQQDLINKLEQLNDIQIATSIAELNKDPSALQQFLQGQNNTVYNNIKAQKIDTFGKVYGDLGLASDAHVQSLLYNKRSRDLYDVQGTTIENQTNAAKGVIEDKNLAGRKTEMNEWSVNNKRDTLFVYSSLFITISLLIMLSVLWKMGIISTYTSSTLGVCAIIIFILILINRAYYTEVLRNKRYWNKRIFEGKYGKIPIPLICPTNNDNINNNNNNNNN
jgi:hypothetical protein